MEKIEYPKVLYKGAETALVQDADEHKALGKGWAEVPNEKTPAAKDKYE